MAILVFYSQYGRPVNCHLTFMAMDTRLKRLKLNSSRNIRQRQFNDQSSNNAGNIFVNMLYWTMDAGED